MRFTIVTPVFNGMPWLPECVASIAAQRDDGVGVEHIVMDPGSGDGTREWLRANAPHAQLRFEVDHGQTDALIRAFSAGTGDIFAWLNADDVFEPGALKRVQAAFERCPRAVGVSGSALTIDADGRVTGAIPTPLQGDLQGLLASRSNLAQPSTFFRADAYRNVGGLDPRSDLAMDVALWLRLARQGTFELLPDDVLSRFRIHLDARSVRAGARAAREDLALRRAAGMPVLSSAGLALVRYGYVQPAIAPLWRRLPGPLRRTLRGVMP